LGWANNVLTGNVSMLVVVNKDSDPLQTGGVPNYTTFRVSSTGTVKTNPAGSTYNLASGVSPAQALMPHGGRNFVGVEFLTGNVAAYSFSTTGVITQQSTSTPTGSTAVLGAVLHPKIGAFYVPLPLQSQLAVYGWNSSTGVLGYKTEVKTMGNAPCWSAINSAATRLYVANTASGTIVVYDITLPASPKELQLFTVTGTGALPTNMAFDTTGNFLYSVDRLNVLHVMNVLSDGTLSETITPVALPTPAGSTPMGIATLSK
jgi:sugar lactone lactonase YvrE